jgi:hypothetical protein
VLKYTWNGRCFYKVVAWASASSALAAQARLAAPPVPLPRLPAADAALHAALPPAAHSQHHTPGSEDTRTPTPILQALRLLAPTASRLPFIVLLLFVPLPLTCVREYPLLTRFF